jgi:hypothetical protein
MYKISEILQIVDEKWNNDKISQEIVKDALENCMDANPNEIKDEDLRYTYNIFFNNLEGF